MTHEQLIRDLVRTLWEPKNVLVPVAFIALFVVSGAASSRILKRLPHFLHKPEMEWGARWVWLILLSFVALALATTYLALTRTAYTISSWLFGKLVLDIGFLSVTTLRYQFYGVLLGPAALGTRLKGRQFNIGAWLAKQERWWSRRWRARALEFGGFALVLLMDAYIILGFTYPIDLSFDVLFRAQRIADAAAASVKRDLRSPRVLKVQGYAPRSAIDSFNHLDVGTVATVRWSLTRAASAVRSKEPPDASVTGEYCLFIRVTRETTKLQTEEILSTARRVLADKGEPHRWRISVYNRDSHLSVTGTYPDEQPGQEQAPAERFRSDE